MIEPWFWGSTFILSLLFVPPLTAASIFQPAGDSSRGVLLAFAFATNLLLLVPTWKRSNSPAPSFRDGLKGTCGSVMSGYANSTVILVSPLLFGVYLITCVRALHPLKLDPDYSRSRWTELVIGFAGRRHPEL